MVAKRFRGQISELHDVRLVKPVNRRQLRLPAGKFRVTNQEMGRIHILGSAARLRGYDKRVQAEVCTTSKDTTFVFVFFEIDLSTSAYNDVKKR